MRPRLHWIFLAMLFALAFGLSWIVNWSNGPLAQLDAATATAADAPAPGDLSAPSLIPPAPAPGDDSSAAPKGAEVLSQGPIHEAFAKPMELDPQAGPIVKKQPPDPIKEIPPAEQPEGDNIVWIPGYWSWDDDRTDFIWVSGVLRAAPPGQTWVPGYWNKVDGGFQWTPGLWTSTAKQEVSYLPQPPQSLENGPSSPQPSDNQFWIPGTYVYQSNDYLWRPGYWTVARPNWIWIPAHYSWTPGGYVFVDGYWDYELTRRGCLFAPVYFAQPVYAQPAFVWTPSVVFNIGLFNDCLFVRPSYCSYYFGDYFAPRYAGIGFSPWFSITIGSRPRFDPLFTYYRWHNSINDRNWLAHTQQHFDTLRRDEALRPAHTFAAQQQWMKNNPGAKGANMALVSSLKDVAKDPGKTDFKFHEVSLADRKALATKGNELQQIAIDRNKVETRNKSQGSGGLGQMGGGSSAQKNNLGLNNSGAAGTTGGNANSGNLTKFKLPTAAASKMTLSQAGNQNQNSTGLGQSSNGGVQKFNRNLGQNSNQGGGQNFDSNNAQNSDNGLGQNKTFGRNSGGANGSGTVLNNNFGQQSSSGGSKFNTGIGQNFDTDSNQQNNFSQRTKTTPRSNLILPDNSLQIGGQGNGNGGGKQNFGGGGNQPSLIAPNLNVPAVKQGGGGGGGGGFKANRGGGGGGGGGGNKDNDDNKKKNTSDSAPPHPYTNYAAAKPSFIDVRESDKADKKATKVVTSLTGQANRSKSSGDLVVSNEEQASAPENDDAAKKSKSSYELPPLFRKSTTTETDPRLRWLMGKQNDDTTAVPQRDDWQDSTPGIDQPGTSAPANERLTGNGSRGANSSEKTAAAPQPQVGQGTAPRSPGLIKYDYQTLMERGRTLSTRTSYAATPLDFPSSTDGATPGPMPRSLKDPVSSMGAGGASGAGSTSRSMYGPQGLGGSNGSGYTSGMPAGPFGSSGSDSTLPRGSGSYMSNSTLPQMPKFDLHMTRPTGPSALPDASSRTYDPTRGY